MPTNAQIAAIAGNGFFQTDVQIASIVHAGVVLSEPIDGSVRSKKRNSLAQQIINDTRAKVEAFSWAVALNSAIQQQITFDSDGSPIISIPDSVVSTAVSEAWDNIAGVTSGDEIVP